MNAPSYARRPGSNELGKSSNLAQRYGINDDNLAYRREFIRLTEEDRQLLASLAPWAEAHADRIAQEFYDWQFAFSRTRAFFEAYAVKMGMATSSLRKRLEAAQASYFRSIFTGARDGFGTSYLESRLHIGHVHDVIDLPLQVVRRLLFGVPAPLPHPPPSGLR